MIGTFEAQVESLTGIAITSGTNPTQDQLTQFLREGVIDVTNKWLIGHPQDRDKFSAASGLQTSQGWQNNVDIISIVREDGATAGNYRPCRKISVAQQSQVADTESLSFASKYHPVYMQDEDGKISVFPAPGVSPNGYKIYYVNEVPQNASAAQLTYAHSNLGHFPDNKLYLVTLFASVKSLHANMTGIIADLSGFTLKTVPPDLPVTAKSIPTYNEAVGGTTINDEITQMLTYIETNEDVELANAKSSEVGLRFKRALDQFSSDMQAYQAENQGEISHYSAEIQAYSAEVTAEVQEQQAKVQTETTKYQWLQDRHTALQAEYIGAFSTPQPQGGGR